MASVIKDSNGTTRVLFVAKDGKRKTVRLGTASDKLAGDTARHIDALLKPDKLTKAEANVLATWLDGIDATLRKRLERVGLIDAPETKPAATLAAFVDAYIQRRAESDAKPATVIVWGQVRKYLVEYFGAEKPLDKVTAGDAEDWRRWLAVKGLSDSTICKRCQFAKMFFRAALKHRLIAENPFEDVKGKGQSDPTRSYFITRAEAQAVLEACPDAQWRLLFALSRFGGLRCPSEHLRLTWADVDWERGRLTVHSSKTEHHVGGASRVIPLFPELRPHVEAVWEQAEPGAQYVITRYRQTNANLGTQLRRIVKRAGLTPWPKLFHNLRATRETELAEQFPLHVVCRWIGNSQTIAHRHYLQVTDAHFEAASGNATVPKGAELKAAHKAAQYGPVRAEIAPHEKQQPPVFPVKYEGLRYCTTVHMEDRGLELPPYSSGETGLDAQSGAQSGALPPDLQAVVDAWPGLSDDAKAVILAVATQGVIPLVEAI